MCAIIADTDYHRFAIGSSCVATNASGPINEIHLVSYSEDANRIDTDLAFSLQGTEGNLIGYEVSQLSSSPYNRGTLVAAAASTATETNGNKLIFYQIKERAAETLLDVSPTRVPQEPEEGKEDGNADDADPQKDTIQEMSISVKTVLECGQPESGPTSAIHSIVWEDLEPMEGQEHSQLITADKSRVQLWDLNQMILDQEIQTSSLMPNDIDAQDSECLVVKRDPHDQKLIALGLEDSVKVLDIRKQVNSRGDLSFTAHIDQVLDLAYNQSRLHTMATSGTDGAVRIWDLRKPDRTILTFDDDHSGHWINKVRYNQYHDQLLLTGSTSTFISLYRACSVSTAPSPGQYGFTDLNNTNTFNMSMADSVSNYSGGNSSFMNSSRMSLGSAAGGRSGSKPTQDKCVQRYELEDSVTAVEWSGADAWVFAALSYNGIFQINTVPSKEKYRILL